MYSNSWTNSLFLHSSPTVAPATQRLWYVQIYNCCFSNVRKTNSYFSLHQSSDNTNEIQSHILDMLVDSEVSELYIAGLVDSLLSEIRSQCASVSIIIPHLSLVSIPSCLVPSPASGLPNPELSLLLPTVLYILYFLLRTERC